jgi:hypothetical protein
MNRAPRVKLHRNWPRGLTSPLVPACVAKRTVTLPSGIAR